MIIIMILIIMIINMIMIIMIIIAIVIDDHNELKHITDILPPHNAGLYAALRREEKGGPGIGYDLLTSTFRDESNTSGSIGYVSYVSASDSRIDGEKSIKKLSITCTLSMSFEVTFF